MNRKEEYQQLLSQLEQETPAALEGCVERARQKARRRRGWQTSLTSLGGVAAAFALMVNLSTPFALACARIPGLRELTAAVALSPSLKAAVENDFVQPIGQRQTADGITLDLEYLIFDRAQLHFFFTVEGGGYDSFHIYPIISGPDGEELKGYSVSSFTSSSGDLSDFSVDFQEGFQVPQALRLTCKITGRKEQGVNEAPADASLHSPAPHREPEIIAQFTFDLELDPRFTAPGKTFALQEWVTVDSQRLLIESLEVNPTHARLSVRFDPDNTAWCQGLDFYLTDARGNRYDTGSRASSGSNLLSSGSDQEGDIIYYLESPHFTGKAPYTLHITQATWLDKGRDWVRVELDRGTAQGLPEGAELISAQRQGEDVLLSFSSSYHQKQLFSWTYRTPGGEELSLHSASTITREREDGTVLHTDEFLLPNYPWSTVEVRLYYTRIVSLPQEVTLEIK